MTDELMQNIDAYLVHHIKFTIAPRFHVLSKQDLRDCMRNYLPNKVGPASTPTEFTLQKLNHMTEVMLDDYYKYVFDLFAF